LISRTFVVSEGLNGLKFPANEIKPPEEDKSEGIRTEVRQYSDRHSGNIQTLVE